MAAGSTNSSPADCSTEADAFGGGGTAANWMRQPAQHDLPRSPRSLPGVGLPSCARSQIMTFEEFASATAMRTALKLAISPDNAIA